jgi:hypothetical protein
MKSKYYDGSLHGFSNPSQKNSRMGNETIDRKLADAVYRSYFGAFVGFEALNPSQRLVPNWHIDVAFRAASAQIPPAGLSG